MKPSRHPCRPGVPAAALAAVLVAGVLTAGAVAAVPQQSLARAGLVITTVDRFLASCKSEGGPSALEARTEKAWEAAHGVARIRAYLQALPASSKVRHDVDLAADALVELVGKQLSPCSAALSVVGTPAAQFTTSEPGLLDSLPTTPTTGGTTGKTGKTTGKGGSGQPPPAGSPPKTSGGGPSAAVLDRIEGFGFDTRAGIGVGGMVVLDVYPLVLFDDGTALTDVTGLRFPGGLAAHRAANPDDWTTWRRVGGTLQTRTEKGWEATSFKVIYQALPKGFRLAGLFRSMRGAGTAAIGGSSFLTAWNEYRFEKDGRVVRGGGVAGRDATGDVSVVTGSVPPGRRGRYRIDGLILQITYDSGAVEKRIIITDPKDPTGAIWLDGVGYAESD